MLCIISPGQSIQQAIDDVHAAGGGRVELSPGVHPSGTLYLKSHVELYLGPGARLQGGTKPEEYDEVVGEGFERFAPEKSQKCFIAAIDAENIAITGSGEINGAGPAFYDTHVPAGQFFAKPAHPRPRMVQFFNCRQVRLEGPSFIDSPGWTIWMIACEDVMVRGVRVMGNQQMINNDGIDIDGCRRVTISDSLFRTGDDCIVLRAVRQVPQRPTICEQVAVTNCILDSRCQAIRLGCPSDDTVRDCTFSNLVLTGNNGIRANNPRRYLMPGCDGYLDLHNLTFSNITIRNYGVPVWLDVEPGVRLRRLGGLTFANLRIESDVPIKIEGCEETLVQDVRFNEVHSRSGIEGHHHREVLFNQAELD